MFNHIVERLTHISHWFSRAKIVRCGAISVLALGLIAGSLSTGIACSPSDAPDEQQAEQPATETPGGKPAQPPSGKCGDGECDEFERAKGICPEDCAGGSGTDYEKIAENEYFVTNPTSGSRLYVKLYPAKGVSGAAPTVILIPGGTGDSKPYTDEVPGGPVAVQFASAGMNAAVFDPEGRGRSGGREDFNGHTGQDGLYYVTQFIDSLPEAGDIGYISQSYGVTLAAGVLARYKNGPAIFLIDWEGPVNREDTTVGCKSNNTDIAKQNSPGDHSCADEPYWAEREAEVFALDMEVPYHRVQSLKDHVQPDVSNAVDMIRSTTHTQYGGNGKSPWTRMNDFEPNTVFTGAIESELTEIDKEKYDMMIKYAEYLFGAYGGGGGTAADREPGTVYFGFMVHLEGWDNEMNNQGQFDKHAGEARKLADIFEDYGAKVTFEASPEFVEGCEAWNDNVLQELHDSGHGIGVHADKGFYPAGSGYTLQQFTSEIKKMRLDMEDLVDFDVQHVSGICSDLDWAKAAIDAGYAFTTGGVGYSAMSMPVGLRPAEYRNCKNPAQCHGNMPLDIADRINPWRISTAKADWTADDPNGKLVYLASDGGIKNLYEETLDASQTHGDFDYSDEDIDVLVDKIEQALSLSDADRVNIIYFSLSIGAADVDTGFYRDMFEALKPYVDSGRLEYKSMNEMYEEYISDL